MNLRDKCELRVVLDVCHNCRVYWWPLCRGMAFPLFTSCPEATRAVTNYRRRRARRRKKARQP